MKYKIFLKNDNVKIRDSVSNQIIEARRFRIDELDNLVFFNKENVIDRVYKSNIWEAVVPA